MGRRGSVWLIDGLEATPTQNLPREKWLDMRRSGIGGSDIPAIMGVSPWSTPLGVYCQKVGLVPDSEQNEAMEFGTLMEPVLRDWTAAKLNSLFNAGPRFKVFASPYLYRHPEHPEWLGNCDGVAVLDKDDTEQLWAGTEFKVVDRSKAREWADGAVPDYVMAQVQWYMGVTGMLHWVIGALIGKRFEARLVDRIPSQIEQMQQKAVAFWQLVEARQMPVAQGKDTHLLRELYDEGITEDMIQAPELAAKIQDLEEMKQLVKLNQAAIDMINAALEQRIGNNKGVVANGYTVIWSRYTQQRVDSKKLKAEHPDVYAAVAKESKTGRLIVKGVGGEESDE